MWKLRRRPSVELMESLTSPSRTTYDAGGRLRLGEQHHAGRIRSGMEQQMLEIGQRRRGQRVEELALPVRGNSRLVRMFRYAIVHFRPPDLAGCASLRLHFFGKILRPGVPVEDCGFGLRVDGFQNPNSAGDRQTWFRADRGTVSFCVNAGAVSSHRRPSSAAQGPAMRPSNFRTTASEFSSTSDS